MRSSSARPPGRIHLSLLLTLGLILSPAVGARDVNDNYAVFGVGSGTCRDYLKARYEESGDAVRFAEWISGHLSAYNLLLDNTYNILGETTPFDFMAKLDAHCRQHRDQAFVLALARQMEALYESRRNLSPEDADSGWQGWLDEMQGRGAGVRDQGSEDSPE